MKARISVENHRGALVPRSLGFVLVVLGAVSTAVVAGVGSFGPLTRAGWAAAGASALVFAAGLVDDLAPIGPRGIRDHLRALAAGRMSTGIVKAVVIVAAAIVAIAAQEKGSGPVRIAGVILTAACANVWNGLDVRPGRALKAGLVFMVGLITLRVRLLPTLPGVAAGALLALWPDLRERAMLGDGGANLLGFTVGLGLFLVLPGWGIGLAAAIAVGLNVVADTVTLSRAIDAVPPLRFIDRLGRLPG